MERLKLSLLLRDIGVGRSSELHENINGIGVARDGRVVQHAVEMSGVGDLAKQPLTIFGKGGYNC